MKLMLRRTFRGAGPTGSDDESDLVAAAASPTGGPDSVMSTDDLLSPSADSKNDLRLLRISVTDDLAAGSPSCSSTAGAAIGRTAAADEDVRPTGPYDVRESCPPLLQPSTAYGTITGGGSQAHAQWSSSFAAAAAAAADTRDTLFLPPPFLPYLEHSALNDSYASLIYPQLRYGEDNPSVLFLAHSTQPPGQREPQADASSFLVSPSDPSAAGLFLAGYPHSIGTVGESGPELQFAELSGRLPPPFSAGGYFDESGGLSPVFTAAAAAAAAFMTRNGGHDADSAASSRRVGGRKPREVELDALDALNDEDKDKKARRRQRNKEAAARCRKRRLDHMTTLQRQVDRLKDENYQKQSIIDQLRQQKLNLLSLLEHNHCLVPKEEVLVTTAELQHQQHHQRLIAGSGAHLELPALHAQRRSVSPAAGRYPMCGSVPLGAPAVPGYSGQLMADQSADSSTSSGSSSNTSTPPSQRRSNSNDGAEAAAASARLAFKHGLHISSLSPDGENDFDDQRDQDSLIDNGQYGDPEAGCSMITDEDPVISDAAYTDGRQSKRPKLAGEDERQCDAVDTVYGHRPTSLSLGIGPSPFDFNFAVTTPSSGLITPSMFNGNEYALLTQRTLLTPIINGPMMLRTPNSPTVQTPSLGACRELRQL